MLSTLKNNLVHSYKHENISEVKNLVWKRLTAQSCDSPVRIDAKDNRFKKDSGTSREALKSLPVNIQLDIKSRDVRNLLPVEKSKAEKWIKQTQPVTLKQDMRSILERRMGALR